MILLLMNQKSPCTLEKHFRFGKIVLALKKTAMNILLNSEHLLLNLRKLLKRGKFFLTNQNSYSKKRLSLHKPIYKNLFLIKKKVYLLNTFLGGFFLKTKPGAHPEILRREGEG